MKTFLIIFGFIILFIWIYKLLNDKQEDFRISRTVSRSSRAPKPKPRTNANANAKAKPTTKDISNNPVTAETTSSPSPSTNNTLIIIGIVFGVLILLFIIGYVIYINSGSKSGEGDGKGEGEGEDSGRDSGRGWGSDREYSRNNREDYDEDIQRQSDNFNRRYKEDVDKLNAKREARKAEARLGTSGSSGTSEPGFFKSIARDIIKSGENYIANKNRLARIIDNQHKTSKEYFIFNAALPVLLATTPAIRNLYNSRFECIDYNSPDAAKKLNRVYEGNTSNLTNDELKPFDTLKYVSNQTIDNWFKNNSPQSSNAGTAGPENIYGVTGTAGPENIYGVTGKAGSENIYGKAGSENIYGKAGSENIYGKAGSENIYGKAGKTGQNNDDEEFDEVDDSVSLDPKNYKVGDCIYDENNKDITYKITEITKNKFSASKKIENNKFEDKSSTFNISDLGKRFKKQACPNPSTTTTTTPPPLARRISSGAPETTAAPAAAVKTPEAPAAAVKTPEAPAAAVKTPEAPAAVKTSEAPAAVKTPEAVAKATAAPAVVSPSPAAKATPVAPPEAAAKAKATTLKSSISPTIGIKKDGEDDDKVNYFLITDRKNTIIGDINVPKYIKLRDAIKNGSDKIEGNKVSVNKFYNNIIKDKESYDKIIKLYNSYVNKDESALITTYEQLKQDNLKTQRLKDYIREILNNNNKRFKRNKKIIDATKNALGPGQVANTKSPGTSV
jgi:hypothetical protein